MSRPAPKEVEFLILLSDHTWIEDKFLIPYIYWVDKDKCAVESLLQNEIELKYYQHLKNTGKSMVAYMLSWWGPEE